MYFDIFLFRFLLVVFLRSFHSNGRECGKERDTFQSISSCIFNPFA